MKKKISVFALLLSLMLSFVVPVPASAATETTADDVKYKDIEDFMHSAGYTSFTKKELSSYLVFNDGTFLHVAEFSNFSSGLERYACVNPSGILFIMPFPNTGDSIVTFYSYYNFLNASQYNDYSCISVSSGWNNGSRTNINNISNCHLYFNTNNSYRSSDLVFSDLDIYSNDNPNGLNFIYQFSNVLYESNLSLGYSFPSWCDDAGLNSIASSNESPSKIPYSFNSYWHIVRRTSSGKWLLTTIGNSVLQENIDSYKLYIGDNGNLHVASIYGGDDVNGYKLNVRQYEYDTDGWKVRTYETYDTRDYSGIVDLGSGSGFDDTRKLAYTNVDVFVGTEFKPTYPKSTEYFDVTDTPVVPDEPDNPTSTPSNPSGGSGSDGGGTGGGTRPESPDIGGDVESGGGLDFIITLFTKIWTDICSVNMSVDGYSINLQQIVIYGALVSIVGGFIMHFIFGRK